jgi:NADP-dependent 3-hydroxy acid dehydrogenase YdfG
MSAGQLLSSRIALITGASRGIGHAIATRLAEEGAIVWGMGRVEASLTELASETGGGSLVADLSDDASVWSALERLTDDIGRAPDIVVNSAGVFGLSSCATESVLAFDESLSVNLRGTFLVVRSLLPGMLHRRKGLIVNIGSVSGRKAYPGNAAYSASKFGLRGFHEVLLEEIRGTGVRATLVEPAATDTALWDTIDPDNDPALPNRSQMMQPGDVAEAVAFVATRPDSVSIPLMQIEPA